MRLKVIQNEVGCFNVMTPTQESFTFTMGIVENGSIVERDGIKAILHYSSKNREHKAYFERPMKYIEHTFESCYEHATKTLYSSQPLKKQCILFAELYVENYDEINENYLREKRVESLPDISSAVVSCVSSTIDKYEQWKDEEKKDLAQIKTGTEKFEEGQNRMTEYNNKISHLKDTLAGYDE